MKDDMPDAVPKRGGADRPMVHGTDRSSVEGIPVEEILAEGGKSRNAPSGEPPAYWTRSGQDFIQFYREFVPQLVRFLMFQGARLEDAADIAQETMRIASQRWAGLGYPYTWARVVASRAWVRKEIERGRETVVAEVQDSALLRDPTVVEEWEAEHHALSLIAQLPPRQRQVMAWTYDGYSPAEIAVVLRIDPAAVRSTLRRARRALVEKLAGRAAEEGRS